MEPNENYFNYSFMHGQIPMMFQQPLNIYDALQRVNEVVCDLRNKYVVKNRSQFDVYDLKDIINLAYYISVLMVNMADILQHIKENSVDYDNQFMLKVAAQSYRKGCEYAKDTTRYL